MERDWERVLSGLVWDVEKREEIGWGERERAREREREREGSMITRNILYKEKYKDS